ncbi:MAG: PCRF domain-containing protein, partial [bacterium]|nr:PCRF domain-containing protein [bacterium]
METIIMEIRAGTGGDEAALFVGDLLKMYEKYSQAQSWRVVVKEKNLSDLGGYKQVALEITGEGVFNKMKNEAGVHRVQRIPKTEKSNRIHTSTVTVAVLKKTKEN